MGVMGGRSTINLKELH